MENLKLLSIFKELIEGEFSKSNDLPHIACTIHEVVICQHGYSVIVHARKAMNGYTYRDALYHIARVFYDAIHYEDSNSRKILDRINKRGIKIAEPYIEFHDEFATIAPVVGITEQDMKDYALGPINQIDAKGKNMLFGISYKEPHKVAWKIVDILNNNDYILKYDNCDSSENIIEIMAGHICNLNDNLDSIEIQEWLENCQYHIEVRRNIYSSRYKYKYMIPVRMNDTLEKFLNEVLVETADFIMVHNIMNTIIWAMYIHRVVLESPCEALTRMDMVNQFATVIKEHKSIEDANVLLSLIIAYTDIKNIICGVEEFKYTDADPVDVLKYCVEKYKTDNDIDTIAVENKVEEEDDTQYIPEYFSEITGLMMADREDLVKEKYSISCRSGILNESDLWYSVNLRVQENLYNNPVVALYDWCRLNGVSIYKIQHMIKSGRVICSILPDIKGPFCTLARVSFTENGYARNATIRVPNMIAKNPDWMKGYCERLLDV